MGATQRRDELSKQAQSQQRQVLKSKGQSGLAAIEFDRNTGGMDGKNGQQSQRSSHPENSDSNQHNSSYWGFWLYVEPYIHTCSGPKTSLKIYDSSRDHPELILQLDYVS